MSVREKSRLINWYLNFVRFDLDSSDVDKLKTLLYEMNQNLFGISSGEAALWITGVRSTKDFEPSPQNIQRAKKIQTALKNFLEELYVAITDEERRVSNYPLISLRSSLLGSPKLMVFPLGGTLHSAILNQPEEKQAILRLAMALVGMPSAVFRKCKECDKLFFHLSKRRKIFCSPNCTSRYKAREKRMANPETYRKKQREIMRKKYAEKKRISPNS